MLQLINTFLSDYYQKLPKQVRGALEKLRLLWLKVWSISMFNRSAFRSYSAVKKIGSVGYTFLLCLLLFWTSVEVNFLWLYGYMPSIEDVRKPPIPLVSEVYSADGVLVGTYYVEK